MIPSTIAAANSDPYCIKLDGATCLLCANGYYLPQSNICTVINPLCKSSNMTTGACTSCYTGYLLSASNCIAITADSIPYCAQVTQGQCSACINGYLLSNTTCIAANPLCATYNSNGNCLSCITGYTFQQGSCILPSLGIDPNCAFYQNSYCSQCAGGYYLVSYWCTAIDPNCLQFDSANNICI